jgi:hypothetical protein
MSPLDEAADRVPQLQSIRTSPRMSRTHEEHDANQNIDGTIRHGIAAANRTVPDAK